MWAAAVSPHGLGLTSDRFWELTLREFYALSDWLPEDFMSRSDRRQHARESREVSRANAKLASMQAGSMPDDLPPWAKEPN